MRSLAVALLLVLTVLTGCDDEEDTFSFEIPSESMEPTFERGDDVTVTAVDDYEPKRGDVIVFPDPGGWLSDEAAGGDLIKRVIGLPGDEVVCCDDDGRLVIGGEPLVETYLGPAAGGCNGPIPSCDWRSSVVPEGMVFVMGDNRFNSADSSMRIGADNEFIAIASVEGVVD